MRYQVLFLMFMIIPLVKVMSLEKATTKNLLPVGMDAKSSLLEKEMNAKGDVTLVEAQEKEMNAKADVTLVEAQEKEMNAKEDVTFVEAREKEMNAKGDFTLIEAQEKKMNTLPIPNLADEMNALDETANSSFLSENLADEMSTTGSSTYIWGVNTRYPKNRIWFRSGISGKWQHVAGLLKKVELSAGSATIWGVTDGGAIFVRVGIHDPKGWRSVSGVLRDVSVSDDGAHIWGIGRNNEVYYRDGHHGNWHLATGHLKQLSVGGKNGNRVWGVTSSNGIYGPQKRSGGRYWEHEDLIYWREGWEHPNWYLVEGRLKQISVSYSGKHIWGVNKQNQIWYRNGVNGQWKQVSGGLTSVSVSSDGSQVWGVNTHNQIFYRCGVNGGNAFDGTWAKAGGLLTQIDVNSKTKVVGQKAIHP